MLSVTLFFSFRYAYGRVFPHNPTSFNVVPCFLLRLFGWMCSNTHTNTCVCACVCLRVNPRTYVCAQTTLTTTLWIFSAHNWTALGSGSVSAHHTAFPLQVCSRVTWVLRCPLLPINISTCFLAPRERGQCPELGMRACGGELIWPETAQMAKILDLSARKTENALQLRSVNTRGAEGCPVSQKMNWCLFCQLLEIGVSIQSLINFWFLKH